MHLALSPCRKRGRPMLALPLRRPQALCPIPYSWPLSEYDQGAFHYAELGEEVWRGCHLG